MALRKVGSLQLAVCNALLIVFCSCTGLSGNGQEVQVDSEQPAVLKNGDIIFHTSASAQSKAIQLATHSQYSHVGIIYENNGKYNVFEAIQPVTVTPLEEFISRGKGGHYVVKRLKNEALLSKDALAGMKAVGEKMKGKDYDLYFGWSDDRIYCSELVYKIYKEGAGIEIGELQKLKDFDLSHPAVQKKLKERYGNDIPYEEPVVSPASLFNDQDLVTIIEQ